MNLLFRETSPMGTKYRVLIFETIPGDVELVEQEMHKADGVFLSRGVYTKEDFVREIWGFKPHIILAGLQLQSSNSLSALQIANEICPDVPLILLLPDVDEEVALKAIRNGAADFIIKRRLSRLISSVNRAIRDAHERILFRRNLQTSEEELKRKVRELEEFYEIAVRRELKMMELKKEIARLNEELEKYREQAKYFPVGTT